jgi:two-component system sensor histidine kinase QseC
MMALPRSLQGRLLVLVLGTVTSVWLVIAVVTWFDARHELDELLDGHLAQAAALLVAQQTREFEGDEHGADIDAPVLHRYAPKVAFQVFHEGRLALRSANAPAAPMAGTGRQFEAGFATVQIDGMAWRVFAARGAERDVQVFVGEQTRSRVAILWAVLRSTLWPMADGRGAAAARAGGLVGRAPRCGAAARPRAHTGRAPTAGAGPGRSRRCAL